MLYSYICPGFGAQGVCDQVKGRFLRTKLPSSRVELHFSESQFARQLLLNERRVVANPTCHLYIRFNAIRGTELIACRPFDAAVGFFQA